MSDLDWSFPIPGKWVGAVLAARFEPNEEWCLRFFDVPSGDPTTPALDAIRASMSEAPVTVTTAALCDALLTAPQVWQLDIRLISDNSVQLYIEDGKVFEMDLPEAS